MPNKELDAILKMVASKLNTDSDTLIQRATLPYMWFRARPSMKFSHKKILEALETGDKKASELSSALQIARPTLVDLLSELCDETLVDYYLAETRTNLARCYKITHLGKTKLAMLRAWEERSSIRDNPELRAKILFEYADSTRVLAELFEAAIVLRDAVYKELAKAEFDSVYGPLLKTPAVAEAMKTFSETNEKYTTELISQEFRGGVYAGEEENQGV